MPSRRPAAVTLGLLAIAGILIYVALDVALVFLRPQFSVLHNAESDYGSGGPYAWVMDLNFLLGGALSLAFVRAVMLAGGVRRRARSVAHAGLIVWALASGALAFFPDDPVGSATHGLGTVHLALAFIALAAVIVGTTAGARAARADPLLRSHATALAVLAYGALVPILLLGHAHLRPDSLGGLYGKIFLAVELLWLWLVPWSIIGARAGQRPPAPAAA